MRLTVLGSGPVQPNPGGACSGYLLEIDRRAFLLDCGSGVLGRLLEHRPLHSLEAIFLSHDHPDHCLDLINIRQALAHAPGAGREVALPVLALPETIESMEALGRVFDPEGFWNGWIEWRPLDPQRDLQLEALRIDLHLTRHYRPCLAMRFRHSGRSLVYTADGGPDTDLVDFARGAQLLLCEATLAVRDQAPDSWGHMSAGEAGRLAADAGVERLLLTHYVEAFGVERLLRAARERCPVPVDLAREGESYDV